MTAEDRSQVDNTTALIAEARRYDGDNFYGQADTLAALADALEAVTVERDSLSRLHEKATERTVQLAAVIEKAAAAVDGAWIHLPKVRDILASAPGDVLREHDAKVLEDARVRPEFTEYLPNDGEYEYASSADCDGSNVKYLRRRPRHIGDYFPWEPTTEELHAAALRVGANPTEEGDHG